jgi:hypothetical protein
VKSRGRFEQTFRKIPRHVSGVLGQKFEISQFDDLLQEHEGTEESDMHRSCNPKIISAGAL